MISRNANLKVIFLGFFLAIVFAGSALAKKDPPPPPPPPPPRTVQTEILSMDLSGDVGDPLMVSNLGSVGPDGTTVQPEDEIMVLLRPAPGLIGERVMQPDYGADDGTQAPGDEIMVLLRPAPGADSGDDDNNGIADAPDPAATSGDEIMVLLRPAPGASDDDNDGVADLPDPATTAGDEIMVILMPGPGTLPDEGGEGGATGQSPEAEICAPCSMPMGSSFETSELPPGTYELVIYPPDPIEPTGGGACEAHDWTRACMLLSLRVRDGTISGSIQRWTDHNEHDPGITALDAVERGAAEDAREAAEEAAREAARDAARDAAASSSRGSTRP